MEARVFALDRVSIARLLAVFSETPARDRLFLPRFPANANFKTQSPDRSVVGHLVNSRDFTKKKERTVRYVSVMFYERARRFSWMFTAAQERRRSKENRRRNRDRSGLRTSARAALAEVVEPATQLHARANTNAFLTHTSRRCMHCALHADARTPPSPLDRCTRPSFSLHSLRASPSFSRLSFSRRSARYPLPRPRFSVFLPCVFSTPPAFSSRSLLRSFSLPPSSSPDTFISFRDSPRLRSTMLLHLRRGSLSVCHSVFHSLLCSLPLRVPAAAPGTHARIVIVVHFPRLSSPYSPSICSTLRARNRENFARFFLFPFCIPMIIWGGTV